MAKTKVIEKTSKKEAVKKVKKDIPAKVEVPETVAEAKNLEEKSYWQPTDDEVLLRSPELQDEFQRSDSWRVFRIMGELVGGFDDLATVTKGISIFGSARTKPDDPNYLAAVETSR